MKRIEVKTSVEIPPPRFIALARSFEPLYVPLDEVAEWLEKTAQACDNAHAISDLGLILRACADSLRTCPEAEVE